MCVLVLSASFYSNDILRSYYLLKLGKGDFQTRRAILQKLRALNCVDIEEHLVRLMTRNADVDSRLFSANSLKEASPLSPHIVYLIAELLKSGCDEDRLFSAFVLSGIGESAAPAINAIVEATSDDTPLVRKYCCEAIANVKRPVSLFLQALIARLREDKDEQVLKAALVSLSTFGADSSGAVVETVKLLEVGSYELKAQASRLLGSIGPNAKGAVSCLKLLSKHEVDYVRESAVDALRRIEAQ